MLLSICIPTRNRKYYIDRVLLELQSKFPSDVEIVISDNSDEKNHDIEKASKWDKRIKYIYTEGEVSFSDNFQIGLDSCDGEYVVTIGDDDFVRVEVLEAIKYAKSENVDAITFRFEHVFYWSGIRGRTKDDECLLRYSDTSVASDIKIIDQRKELKEFAENGLSGFDNTNLARIYHGVVSRKLISQIQTEFGRLYGGLSPDIYSSIMLSANARKVVRWNRSLTIPGVSSKSGSGQSASGSHRGLLKNAPHFRGNNRYVWEPEVPAYYSVNTIWAESALKALKLLNDPVLSNVNWNKFNGISIVENRQLLMSVFNNIKKSRIKSNILFIFLHGAHYLAKRIFKKITLKNFSVVPLKSINDADSYLSLKNK